MNLDQFEEKVNKKNTKFEHDLKYEIGTLITFGRIQSGFSQEKLAKQIKTQQPSVARIESGRTLPSLSFLEKIANAMNMYIEVKFIPIGKIFKKDLSKFSNAQEYLPTEEILEQKLNTGSKLSPFWNSVPSVSSSLLTN